MFDIMLLAFQMDRTRVATFMMNNDLSNMRFPSLDGISGGIHELSHRPAATARILATGLAYQLILIGSALMAARALGLPAGAGPTALLAFLPAVLIAQVLPISISGLGVREGVMILHASLALPCGGSASAFATPANSPSVTIGISPCPGAATAPDSLGVGTLARGRRSPGRAAGRVGRPGF